MGTAAAGVAAPGTPPRSTDGFASYAVATRSGPHVTVQAGVVQSGRFTTTTSRTSLKARCVRQRGAAAALVEHDDGTTELLAGATVSVDLRHPEGILTDPAGALVAGPAALRLAGDQLEQLLGYVEAAGRVPSAWLPHNRVLLVTRIDRSMVLQGFEVLGGTGDWAADGGPGDLLVAWAADGGPGDLLVAADQPPAPLPELPDDVAPLVHPDAPARVGFATSRGPVVLPARWRGDDRFDVSADGIARLGAEVPGPACATFDDSADRRPDRKRGVMLRGSASLIALDEARATVAVTAARITAWDGFSARTTDVDPEP